MTRVSHALGLAAAAHVFLACGSEPPPKTAPQTVEVDEPRDDGPNLEVSGEVGGLDKDAVTRVFMASAKELQACLNAGAERVEFIGGSVAFYVKIDSRGRLMHAHLEQSSVGDRETEKCMLDSLRHHEWPAPVGGETGFARKSFDFDPPNDVRAPTDWSVDRVQEAIDDKSSEIKKCKGSAPGNYSVTMYVNTKGKALAVGIAPPDERGEDAVDCLVEVLKSASYPSPGSWPAKVSFSL